MFFGDTPNPGRELRPLHLQMHVITSGALVGAGRNHSIRKDTPMDYVNLGKTGLKVSRLCLGVSFA